MNKNVFEWYIDRFNGIGAILLFFTFLTIFIGFFKLLTITHGWIFLVIPFGVAIGWVYVWKIWKNERR